MNSWAYEDLEIQRLFPIKMNTLNVPTGEREKIDFSSVEVASTMYLEQCVAVATRSGDEGTLAHLTLKHDQTEFFEWLEKNSPKDSRVYLAGGREGDSKDYISALKEGLHARGYAIEEEDLLTRPEEGFHMRMLDSGEVEVQKYRWINGPLKRREVLSGTFSYDPSE